MNKKTIVVAIAMILTCSASFASNQDLNILAEQAKEIQANHAKQIDSQWIEKISSRGNIFEKSAQEISKHSVDQALESMGSDQELADLDKSIMESYRYLIFATFNLDEKSLKDILISASGRDDTAVLFRGIPDGLRIDEGMELIQAIAKQVEPVPNVILDPTPFKENGVTVAPTLLVRDDEGKTIATVKGLHNPDWIQEQVDNGKTGYLGFLGTAEIITERDIIEVMQERANAIDWEEKKKGALTRAWGNVRYAQLPAATEDSTRKIPASVRVTADIKTPDGKYIAKAGDVVNPLKERAFTTAYIVFNPTRKIEIDFVKRLKEKVLEDYKNVVFMFSQFDAGEDGWESFKELTDTMDSHVYNLVPEVMDRFQVERTPTLITADDENFIVKEFKVSSNE
ncbi:TrbC family F-type conjugative pilus assembly protein [Thiopseudomonas alkaliphila]|uniref:TrbC family F-type conjugative pilus assembly protein n=1 Tax=Thiopseudomonas alkaliphila TaxID=1697053 RepID=UPI0025767618|nr:TrbC family F-type conjugative pilus assembly protein [Thiopseudomonas alkaliphila]MDM1717359.1 hypothetical protein [Thiopseudomonas alkaliphila]